MKSSAIIEGIDRDAERLRYFHNASLFDLDGEDYRGVFRTGREFSADVLPPYTELLRFDAGPRLEGEELRRAARALLLRHLGRRPRTNPFHLFGEQLAATLPELLEGDAEQYHAYAFATVRMAGSAFELAASHLRWLLGAEADPAAEALQRVVDGCKVLSFRLARRRAFDPGPIVADLAAGWDDAMHALDAAL